MARKSLPAEALLDLRRRLGAFPPRSPARRAVMQETGALYGISEAALYRALHQQMRPKALRRADCGQTRSLPTAEMERYCELIAAIKFRTSNKQGRCLSTGEAIRLLEEHGLDTPDGFIKARRGLLKVTTVTLRRLQEQLEAEGEILVARSLSVDKEGVTLAALLVALFCDLSTDKDLKISTRPEKRERSLRELIKKRKKPVALFIDEAHGLKRDTLVGLKRLMELVNDGGGILSVVLAGHPKLNNELRRPTNEEIGNRATLFSLDNVHGANREYIHWLLEHCAKAGTEVQSLFADEAVDLLAERLTTPLQIVQHLTLALEEAFQIGGQPVTTEVVESVLAKDINEMEPKLTRHGYGHKALAEILNIGQGDVRKLLRGQLPPGRALDLQAQMLKAGLPL